MNKIYFYYPDKPYAELMNFYYSEIIINNKKYKTVEHYFQACKATNEKDHEKIRRAPSPRIAKKMGLKVKLREDWESVKEDIMLTALRAKFTQHSRLREVLLSTGDSKLYEKSPKDMYWGYKGKNRLGILLEQVREEIKNGEL